MPSEIILFAGLGLAVAAVFAFKWWKRRIPSGWIIGPIINGKNYSKGLPLRPEPTATGWRVTGGEPHYITRDGRRDFTFRYRVTGTFTAVEGGEARLSAHFQTSDNNWSGAGEHANARWYSREHFPLTEGEHSVSVPLEAGAWVNVMGQAEGLRVAAADMQRFGVVLGNASNRGHGVRGGTLELLEWGA